MCFCDWFLPIVAKFSRFILTAACASTPFLFPSNSILPMDRLHLAYPFTSQQTFGLFLL